MTHPELAGVQTSAPHPTPDLPLPNAPSERDIVYDVSQTPATAAPAVRQWPGDIAHDLSAGVAASSQPSLGAVADLQRAPTIVPAVGVGSADIIDDVTRRAFADWHACDHQGDLGSDRQGDLERGRSGAPVVGPESAEVAARAIAAARTHRGWSQRELARAAHTTQARINGIETATGNPTLRTIAQVLAVLDLELVVRERVGRPTLAPHPMLPFFVARIDHEALAQERGRSVTLRLQPLGGRAMITQILPTDAREGDA